jgi:hypothetical protein
MAQRPQPPASLRFKGYEAVRTPSQLGSYQRLAYDRNQPWEKDIVHFDRCVEGEPSTRPRPTWCRRPGAR